MSLAEMLIITRESICFWAAVQVAVCVLFCAAAAIAAVKLGIPTDTEVVLLGFEQPLVKANTAPRRANRKLGLRKKLSFDHITCNSRQPLGSYPSISEIRNET